MSLHKRSVVLPRSYRLIGGWVVFLLVALSCNLIATPPEPPPTEPSVSEPAPTEPPVSEATPTEPPAATDTPISEAAAVFSLQRLSAAVSAGASDPLSEVLNDRPQPFPEGSFVKVDTAGEALLTGSLEGSQCKIFVFFDTRLQKKACEKSAFTGSNVSCIEEGSAVFDRCSNMLVQTPTSEFQLKGTWILATYLPGQQLSVLSVSNGLVEVHPVTDADSYTTGDPVMVGAGQFLYTAPDDMLSRDQVAGLEPRQALLWENISPLVRQYDLEHWYDRARDHAGEVNVPFPDQNQLAGPPDLIITLESRDATDADLAILKKYPGFIGVPVRATVVNQGGQPADPFKVSVDGTASDGTYVRAFTVPGQRDLWYPHTAEPLGPDTSVIFDGVVLFPEKLAGEQLTLVATADSCSGEELAPQDCGVAESDEGNNTSAPLNATVPIGALYP